jgi:Thiolase, C-terminal domain
MTPGPIWPRPTTTAAPLPSDTTGRSGARTMTTLVNALEQHGGRYGLQTMCEGGGMATATIIERLS